MLNLIDNSAMYYQNCKVFDCYEIVRYIKDTSCAILKSGMYTQWPTIRLKQLILN